MAIGFSVPFLLRAAAQLNLADHLADGPKTAAELAVPTGADAPALYRLLRTLASIGIFSEDEPQRFAMNALAGPLRSNVPGSVRTSILSCTGSLFIIPWSNILYSVQTGQPSFDEHFGAPFFDYISKDDGPGQCIFIVTLCRPVALRAAWLRHQLARMSLAHSMRQTGMRGAWNGTRKETHTGANRNASSAG
jgi:hypothetical protein